MVVGCRMVMLGWLVSSENYCPVLPVGGLRLGLWTVVISTPSPSHPAITISTHTGRWQSCGFPQLEFILSRIQNIVIYGLNLDYKTRIVKYYQLSKILGITRRIPSANILTVSKDIKNIKRVNMLTVSYWGNAIIEIRHRS